MLALPPIYLRNLTSLRLFGVLTVTLVATLYWRSGILQLILDWLLTSIPYEAGVDSAAL